MCLHVSQHTLTKVNFSEMTIYVRVKVIGGLILEYLFHASATVSFIFLRFS